MLQHKKDARKRDRRSKNSMEKGLSINDISADSQLNNSRDRSMAQEDSVTIDGS